LGDSQGKQGAILQTNEVTLAYHQPSDEEQQLESHAVRRTVL
jgi:hypothetical protein